jgi:uncharacterized protein YbjT (DUF2867 family)
LDDVQPRLIACRKRRDLGISRSAVAEVRIMILVTGATGKTGRALVKRLVGLGVPVRAVVRDRAKAPELAAAGVEVAVADLAQPETLAPAVDGISKAYLMTAADPEQVLLHGNFIRAAKLAGIRHIVRHSVRGADSGSPVKLGRWHAASQAELEASGIAWTHLHPVYNMQNFLKFAPTIRSEGAFYAPMEDWALSMVDARDVADVAAAVLCGNGHEGATYVITGPEPVTFADAARHLSTALGQQVRYIDVTPQNARAAWLKIGMPDWYVDDLLGFYAFYRTAAGAVVSDAVARLTAQPGRSFLQFAQDYQLAFAGAP